MLIGNNEWQKTVKQILSNTLKKIFQIQRQNYVLLDMQKMKQ